MGVSIARKVSQSKWKSMRYFTINRIKTRSSQQMYFFMIKTLNKLGIKLLKLTKGIYVKTHI